LRVGCKDTHSVELGNRLSVRGQFAANDLVLVKARHVSAESGAGWADKVLMVIESTELCRRERRVTVFGVIGKPYS
jgi:hypothetical protein